MSRVRTTLHGLGEYRDLAVLLVSTFFALSGIYIIITYAFIYGAQVIGWDEHVRTLMFIFVQITAAAGAFAFGFIQDRVGALRTYRFTLLLWMLAIALIYLTPALSDAAGRFGLQWEAQYIFW